MDMNVLNFQVCTLALLFSQSLTLQPHGLQPSRVLCPWDSQQEILEWVVISFFRGCSQPGIKPGSPCILCHLSHQGSAHTFAFQPPNLLMVGKIILNADHTMPPTSSAQELSIVLEIKEKLCSGPRPRMLCTQPYSVTLSHSTLACSSGPSHCTSGSSYFLSPLA